MFRLRIEGLDRIPATGPALLVANHVSFLDPAVLLAVANRRRRKIRFLCVAEAFEKPVLGSLLRAGRQIPVGDSHGTRANALAAALDALARGEVVLVYPEGTIPTNDPAIGQVRPQRGAGVLALTAGVPVVPIASRGLERGRPPWRPWRRWPARIVIGTALNMALAELDGRRDRDAFAAASLYCYDAVRTLRDSMPTNL
jgi:1-acyl-sn-glycerol-3-phosphate acyltransferase